MDNSKSMNFTKELEFINSNLKTLNKFEIVVSGKDKRAALGEYIEQHSPRGCFIDAELEFSKTGTKTQWPNLFEVSENPVLLVINRPDLLDNNFEGEEFDFFLELNNKVIFLIQRE